MLELRVAKEKEKQEDTVKRAQQHVYFFPIKALVKRSNIEYSRDPCSKILMATT